MGRGGEGHQIHAEAIVVTDHSPPCHYIPGDGATLGPLHRTQRRRVYSTVLHGFEVWGRARRGSTRDIGLGNLGIAAAVLPAGCGWAAAITTHLHFLIVERWSQIYSAPPATREHWESKNT